MSGFTDEAPPSRVIAAYRDRPRVGLRLGVAGHHLLWKSFALLFAFWLVQAALRALELGRPAPYGSPLVERFEWYYFHALAFDARWALPLLAPVLAFYLLVRPPRGRIGRLYALPFRLAFALHLPLVLLVLLDHEVMRYMGVHASPDFVRTYVGGETVRDLGSLVSTDRGGPYLPIALIFAAPAALFALTRWLGRRFAARRVPPAALLAVALGWPALGLPLTRLWGGSFREARLTPVVRLWLDEARKGRTPPLAPAAYAAAREAHRAAWREASGRAWAFPDEAAPFYRLTEEEACRRGLAGGERCDRDDDGDGAPARADCDDARPEAHPGAADLPSNGVDEDCSGADARPWNVLLVILETHRALEVGHLQPYGATGAATPRLDALAARGAYWTRHSVNGLPTIDSFFSIHCSLYGIGEGHIATSHTVSRYDCLPEALRRRGYEARFFTAVAPDWDNQTIWLSRWYDGYDYARERQTDLSMMRHLARWMREHLDDQRPFFVAAMTKTNHFPFNGADDMTPEERAATPDRIGTTMRYADRALGELLDALEGESFMRRTLVVVTGDHGIHLGERGAHGVGAPLGRAVSWVPLVVAGDHPRLAALRGPHDEPSSHVDLMPTLLDLLGIHDPTASVGHSLVEPAPAGRRYAYMAYADDLALERGGARALLSRPGAKRAAGDQLFDARADFLEANDRATSPEGRAELDRLRPLAASLYELTLDAVTYDRVLPATPPK
ncbi:MAG TPA: sulfatase-like hydrolase/transferase [Polyangiaceae bacterium]|nr:sulfatase-like hydrolase/transferase [Polyangiaceae bacterium]